MCLVGVQVTITGHSVKNGKYVGCTGIVERTYKNGMIGVRLEGKTNQNSRYGVFWFPEKDIEEIESEDETIMLNGYKVAKVSFPNSEIGHGNAVNYALYDQEIKQGDYVVVSTGHHGFVVGVIDDIFDSENLRVSCNREVVCKANMTAFFDRKKKEERLVSIKAEMDMKVREIQKNLIYEALAEKDDSLKVLLDEFKELQK